ncbi:LCP family protein [Streptomyces yaizuensis]|uniref:LCP family protein n=1 Tax=Streptomyces yaizuensis TaxID=2989713 RepID=A0ABQ5P9H4_9ACTN|nr:LCP family protein [Streptomyces sp. YSPA8]GLF99239.1 LCP family protein [Streptomyces sp. YSPA8]
MGQRSVHGEGIPDGLPGSPGPGHHGERGPAEGPAESAPLPGPRAGRRADRGRPPGRGRGRQDPPGAGGSRRAKGRGAPRGGARRGRKGRSRVLRWIALALSVAVLATGAAGYLYYEHLNSKIKKDRLNLGQKMPGHQANAAGQTPLNILVIGSDARDNKENQKLGGAKETFDKAPLADVQMLVHLSADRSNISVVTMPRDTMLTIPECTDPKTGRTHPANAWIQTNESLGRGGAGCTVATWFELTGITIDHFMMLDFTGVVSMADAIGGVEVCVQDSIHSRTRTGEGSGLKLPKGDNIVKGEDALKWLRTRYGFGDGTDLYRARAQHMYMGSMVRQLRKEAKLTDPNKLRKLAEAAIGALTVDDRIDTVTDLLKIGDALKGVPPERMTMLTMPNEYSTRPGFTGKVIPKPGEAEQLFRMIREDIPLDGKGVKKKKKPAETVSRDPAAAPAEIAVSVRNGTDGDGMLRQKGRAAEVSGLLQAKGYTRAAADATADPRKTTAVLYSNAELEGDAQAVARALGIPLKSVKKSAEVTGVQLTVGADWRLGTAFPKPVADDAPPKSSTLVRADKKDCMPIQPGFTW